MFLRKYFVEVDVNVEDLASEQTNQ